MDYPTKMDVLRRLQREIEMLTAMEEVMQKNCDRNNRLGLKEVAAFESGVLYARQYTHEVMVRLMDMITGNDKSDDG